jgi:hypothetical protein
VSLVLGGAAALFLTRPHHDAPPAPALPARVEPRAATHDDARLAALEAALEAELAAVRGALSELRAAPEAESPPRSSIPCVPARARRALGAGADGRRVWFTDSVHGAAGNVHALLRALALLGDPGRPATATPS